MSLPASRLRTVFRACVVNAVRGGEALMGQLVKVTQSALTSEESASRNIQQRNLLSDALRLLNEHEAALVKGYPMALLEIFAEGPAVAKGRSSADDTGMDFGELSLMDESEMQAQVELSKAQQSALHATDAEWACLRAQYRWPLLMLGLVMALLAHLPVVGLLVPALAALSFVHFGLEALRRLRGGAIVSIQGEHS